ncbi:Maf family nucleotide pyrophosphatase [Kaistella palustris]|uniref:Maf family nucleotide pyrophosphatase n=1 Tax=Kaistella palustris TaxID=493376 RepID=UPI0003F7C1E0|nr:Maf family nucleotide pyrophosphatase [Kaistella palustris]
MKLLLASNSPRRKELLQSLGYDFKVVSVECDEIYPEEISVHAIAGYLAELKSNSYKTLQKDEVLITADTVVVLDGEVLGKPDDALQAAEMLRKLSGRTHEVYTGITLRAAGKKRTVSDRAKVYFQKFSPEEIDFYISRFRPFDKAGSYGIQEWLGMAKISKIEGSFYTIMGLPTHLIYENLKDFGEDTFQK